MTTFSSDDLKTILAKHTAPCISIFMPTHRAGAQGVQDPIRLRNLLRKTEERLLAQGGRLPDVQAWLAPVQRLLDDGYFWRHQENGLALFASPDLFQYHCLPSAVTEAAVVGPHFYIRPLLPLLDEGDWFYVLALSQNAVRLFRGNHYHLEEVGPSHIPNSLAEAFQHTGEKEVMVRSGAPVGAGKAGAIFYGGGDLMRETKARLLHACQRIDQGLHDLLRAERAPLVLAGVSYLLAIFREVSRYPHLMAAEIVGSPERLSRDELRSKAWGIVQPYFEDQRAERLSKFHQFAREKLALTQVPAVVQAAYHRSVDTLFVATEAEQWGRVDELAEAVEVHPVMQPDDEDLVNLAALQTLRAGGNVYCVQPGQMPDQAALAAVLNHTAPAT